MSITLYDYWRSSAAYRVRIALNIKGVDYRPIKIDIMPGADEQMSASYRVLNPQMRVPAIEVNGEVVGQSMAILEYLEEAYPAPSILPADPVTRLKCRAFADTIACDIHPLNTLRVLISLKGPLGQDAVAVSAWYRHWIAEGLAPLEELANRHGDGKRFLYGNAVTMADVCLVPQVYNARRFGCDLAPYPALVAVDEHLNTLPAFIVSRPEAQPDAE